MSKTQPKRADVVRLADELEKIMTRTPGGFPSVFGIARAKTADEIAPAVRGDLDRAREIADSWGAIQAAGHKIKTECPDLWTLYRAFLFRWKSGLKRTSRAAAIVNYSDFHEVPRPEVERAAMVPQMIAAAALASSLQNADRDGL